MKKLYGKIILIVLATILLAILTISFSDAASIDDPKYHDQKVWSNPALYSAEEIQMNKNANFNIAQYLNDLRAESGYYGHPEDKSVKTSMLPNRQSRNMVAPQVTVTDQTYHDKFIATLATTKSVTEVVYGWASPIVTVPDKVKIWSQLTDEMKVMSWRQLPESEQVQILKLTPGYNWFPVDMACTFYTKTDMLALWKSVKSINDPYYEVRLTSLYSVSAFNKYRFVTYLGEINLDDKNMYITGSRYDTSLNETFVTLLPKLYNTSDNTAMMPVLNGRVILFESLKTTLSDLGYETFANMIYNSIDSFMREYPTLPSH